MSDAQAINSEILVLFKPMPADDFSHYIFATGQAKINDELLSLARDFRMSLKGQDDEETAKITDITEDVLVDADSALETVEPVKVKAETKSVKKKKRSSIFKRAKKSVPEALHNELIVEDPLEISDASSDSHPKKPKPTASRRFKNIFVKHGPRAFVGAKNAVQSKFQKLRDFS